MADDELGDLPSGPMDPETAARVAEVAEAAHNRPAKDVVVAAIRAVAVEHDGAVDPNVVRARLASLNVHPRVVGSVYSHLVAAGALVQTGWTTSTDTRGGNAGKPCRVYRYVPDGER